MRRHLFRPINGQFIELLERRFDRERAFRLRRDQLHLVHAAVEDLPGEAVYDVIISGLPLNSFFGNQVREVFRAYTRLLKSGGTLSYYEYLLVRQLAQPFVNRRERRRLYRVGRVVRGYIRTFQVRRQQVLINFPPAVVRHLHLKPLPGESVERERRKPTAFPLLGGGRRKSPVRAFSLL